MLPSLLPYAIAVFVLATVGLVLLLKWYRAARPGTAVIVHRDGADPIVLLTGGAFVRTSSKVEVLDMTERSLSFSVGPDTDLTVVLRPRETVAAVLEIAKTIGIDRCNDPQRLTAYLQPTFEKAVVAAEPDSRASIEAAAPWFDISACDVRRGPALRSTGA